MAFFANEAGEFFSLNLHARSRREPFVYPLTRCQSTALRWVLYPLLEASAGIFVATAGLAIGELWDWSSAILSEESRQTIAIGLAAAAVVCAYIEILFFFWLRHSPASSRPDGSEEMKLQSGRSAAAYLVILLNMLAPFLAIVALPGGTRNFQRETVGFGPELPAFLTLLHVAVACVALALIGRIWRLLRWRRADHSRQAS